MSLGPPRCSFVRVEHSVATLCFCPMARAIHSLSNSTVAAHPQPPPLPSGVTSADWPPVVQSFRGSFQPPFRIPQFQPFYTTNARIQTFTSSYVRPLSPSLAKVKSYGSVKATLLVPSFLRQYIFLRLFPDCTGACKGLKYFNQSSWNVAASTISSSLSPYRG